MWDSICQQLSDLLGKSVEYQGNSSVSGGCIHNAQRLETNAGTFFVKSNRTDSLTMFEAEAAGLEAIRASNTVRCPNVYFSDVIENQAILVLEYIAMQGAQSGSMTQLGNQLAAMHRVQQDYFGWHIDNNIGLTEQKNTRETDWISFYRFHRLEFQIGLCERKGLSIPGKNDLLENLNRLFDGYEPQPSLLHGDLWGGNVGFDEDGHPVLFDPGCYFGDREADLAFTEMFGGFSNEFYQAYQTAFPLNEGYRYRKRLYNLYHELNHYYLFGGGYGRQAQESVRYLLTLL